MIYQGVGSEKYPAALYNAQSPPVPHTVSSTRAQAASSPRNPQNLALNMGSINSCSQLPCSANHMLQENTPGFSQPPAVLLAHHRELSNLGMAAAVLPNVCGYVYKTW